MEGVEAIRDINKNHLTFSFDASATAARHFASAISQSRELLSHQREKFPRPIDISASSSMLLWGRLLRIKHCLWVNEVMSAKEDIE